MVDCLHWIPPSGTPAHHHKQDSNTRHHTRSTSRHPYQDRYRNSRSRPQSHPYRYHNHSCHDSHRGHSRSHHRDSRCHHRSNAITTVLTVIAITHHTEYHPHTVFFQFIQKTAADHVLHIKQVRKLCISCHPILAELQ